MISSTPIPYISIISTRPVFIPGTIKMIYDHN